MDNVGNINTEEFLFFIDGEKPVTEMLLENISYTNGEDIYINNSSRISFESFSDDIKETLYSINDGEYLLYNRDFNLYGYDPGNYVLRYYSVDSIGNKEEAEKLKVQLEGVGASVSLK